MRTLALNTPYSVFVKEVENYPLLSRDEEHELAVKYCKKQDLSAANKLVLSNLRFVIKISNEYKSYGFPVMDLIQEGTIGLMHAIKKFDPYKGYRLISYAVWWIRARIHNHIMKFWSVVKIGTTQAQRKLFHKVSSAKRKLGIDSGALSKDEISKLASHFEVEEREVAEMELRQASRDFSLHQNRKENESQSYIDMVPDENDNMDQEKLISDSELRSIAYKGIEEGLKQLNDREKKVIEERFYSEEPKKLLQLGNELGISKERVRQIEKTAVKKLQKAVKKAIH